MIEIRPRDLRGTAVIQVEGGPVGHSAADSDGRAVGIAYGRGSPAGTVVLKANLVKTVIVGRDIGSGVKVDRDVEGRSRRWS